MRNLYLASAAVCVSLAVLYVVLFVSKSAVASSLPASLARGAKCVQSTQRYSALTGNTSTQVYDINRPFDRVSSELQQELKPSDGWRIRVNRRLRDGGVLYIEKVNDKEQVIANLSITTGRSGEPIDDNNRDSCTVSFIRHQKPAY